MCVPSFLHPHLALQLSYIVVYRDWSYSLKNISLNLLGADLGLESRAAIDWQPPTAFGLDNSKRLADAAAAAGVSNEATIIIPSYTPFIHPTTYYLFILIHTSYIQPLLLYVPFVWCLFVYNFHAFLSSFFFADIVGIFLSPYAVLAMIWCSRGNVM